MADRIQRQTHHEDTPEPDDIPIPTPGGNAAQGFDDILDEIDDVLEENALSFVQGFVQKGGE